MKKKKIEVVSERLADGTLIETLYDPTCNKTLLAVSKDGDNRVVSEIKLSDGKTVVPMQANNPLLKNRLVSLPSEVGNYQSVDQLLLEVQGFVHRYVDVSDQFEKIDSYYVLLTWLYDDFSELPYLRRIGDFGSGKTRFLRVMGAVCYKAIFASGGTSVAALFHIIDKVKGTLILDEADFRFSDERSDIAKILNNGNAKGFPILRVAQNKDGQFSPISYDVFCPKIIAARNHYSDAALESRFITETSRVQKIRADIPTTLPDSFESEALVVRNKLLAYRFAMSSKVAGTVPAGIDQLEGRIRQIFDPLLRLAINAEDRKTILSYAQNMSDQIQTERAMSVEAQVLTCIKTLQAERMTLSVKAITSEFFIQFSDFHDRRITAKWIGSIVRKKLSLSTERTKDGYVLCSGQNDRLNRYFERYGLACD